MTQHNFGAVGDRRLCDPPGPEDLDPVADALAGEYDAAELAELAAVVADDDSAHRAGTPAARLLAQLRAAHRDATRPATPPAPRHFSPAAPVAFSLYASPDPGAAPLEVVFGDGERGTVVPAGRHDWRLAEECAGAYLGEPAPGHVHQVDGPPAG